jgi:hypothetical protein
MAMSTKGGHPAFPTSPNGDYAGMTMREWYAGQAVAGLSVQYSEPEDVAQRAFAIADAMLQEATKEKK